MGQNTGMCIGFGSLVMLCALVVELVLGFCNFDDNKLWGFGFIACCIASSVLTVAAGSITVDQYDADPEPDKYDNLKYYNFVLVAAPVAYRSMMVFMKCRDVALQGAGAKA